MHVYMYVHLCISLDNVRVRVCVYGLKYERLTFGVPLISLAVL